MQIAVALIAGLLFGSGIVIAGMANPAKVLNFFDVAGTWDPSLAFVMGGALAVTALGYRLVLRQPKPVLADRFHLPAAQEIDTPLLAGAAVFGVGWGLSGFCPGGLIPALSFGSAQPWIFLAAMLGGMIAARQLRAALEPASGSRAAPSR
jgi:uncharacterized membrane protein YedE/YeeE